MVVNEKGLLKAMKDAYKTDGYTVAVDEADLILKTVTWTVVLHMEEVPSKVLALITEHLRKLPDPGTAYQVKKKETQTEIFRMVKEEILNFHTSEKPRRIIRRTELTLGGFPLWQAATEKTVVKVCPDYEDMSTRELHQAIRELDEAKKAQQEAEARAEEAEASLEEAQKAAENQIRQLEQAAKDEKTVTNAMRSRAEAAEKAQADAKKRESAALEKVSALKKQLEDARAEVKKLRDSPVIPDDLMKSMQQEAEEVAAKKAEANLQKKLEAAEAEVRKAQQERKAAEESARSAREQLEVAQKNAKLSDPDLMAVQVLGQQILTQWNVILGHRKKVIAKDATNADPIDAFLRKMLDTMVEGLGRDCNKHTT